MSDNKKDFEGLGELLDHNYDNIQELDNPLPGWWLMTFYGTIIFAFVYVIYYHAASGPSLDEELAAAMGEIKSQITAAKVSITEDELKKLAQDPNVLQAGAVAFAGKCLACHGAKGEGLIGPNLTDEYWLNSDGSLLGIQGTIKNGVLEKGMPAWEAAMTQDEINAATVFIRSLYGSNPANAKAPQGEKREISL